MSRLLEMPLKLTTGAAVVLSTVFALLSAVTWLAARDAILFVAPVVVYALAFLSLLIAIGLALFCFAWFHLKWSQFRRDRILATNEARMSDLATEQQRMQMIASGQLLAATVRQVERGYIHPSTLADTKFSAFPAAVVNKIEQGAVPLLEAVAPPAWPKNVNLFDLLPSSKNGNLDDIILGVNLDKETGRQTIVRTPLEEMVHCAYGGETGTGKSTLAYSVAYQIATAPQGAQLILADPAGTTWKTLADCDRLMFPLAQSENDTLYILNELHKISINRTDKIFGPYPTVEKLSDYNALVGPDNQLGHIVMFIDEFPEYLENDEIETMLRRLIRKSRKAGIYIFGMGTSWKHSDMDTSIRRQFRTKVHFAASDPDSSRVLLGTKDAANLKDVGRAYARLPFNINGVDLVEVQTAYIDKVQVYERMSRGSILDLPVQDIGPSMAEQAVINAWQNGGGLKECYRIWVKVEKGEEPPLNIGGNQTAQIKEILKKWGVEGV